MLLKTRLLGKGNGWLLIALTSFLATLILFLRTWRNTPLDTEAIIGYVIFLFVFVLLVLLVSFELQKLAAKKLGYIISYTPSTNALLISLLLGFMFRGFLFMLFLGDVQPEIKGNVRLGKFRPDLHVKDVALISIVPVAFTLVLALILAGINSAAKNPVFSEATNICVFFSLFMLLPTQNNYGLNIFRWNKKIHLALIVISLLLTALLVADLGVMIALFISLFLALIIGFIELIPKVIYS